MFRRIAVVLSIVTFLMTAQPKRAEASFVGYVFTPVGVVLAVGGLATSLIGTIYMVDGALHNNLRATLVGAGIVLIGLVILDQDATTAMEFNALTAENAKRLGVSAEAHAAYEAERDAINAIAQTVASETAANMKATGETSQQSQIEFASARWAQYRSNISAEAYSVMQAIASDLHNQLPKAAN